MNRLWLHLLKQLRNIHIFKALVITVTCYSPGDIEGTTFYLIRNR